MQAAGTHKDGSPWKLGVACAHWNGISEERIRAMLSEGLWHMMQGWTAGCRSRLRSDCLGRVAVSGRKETALESL